MKQLLSLVSLCFAGVVIVAVALLQSGCEEAKGLQGLTVDPSSVTLTTNGQTQVFTVTGVTNDMALPLTWTVSNEGLGQIISSMGYTAVYQRFAPNGMNSITVRDQYDNEGFASIRQSAVAYSLELESSASTTGVVVNTAVTITIKTTDAQPPFAWRKVSGPGTLTADSGSRSAVFSSSVPGTAAIEVKDANGASGVIGVLVQAAGDDGGGDDGGGGGPGGLDP